MVLRVQNPLRGPLLAGSVSCFPEAFLSSAARPTEDDVAIVGGGAIGCVVAYVFAAAGIDVALFESGRLAHGGAAGGSGIVVHEPETDLHALIAQHGLRDGRHLYQTARRGSLEYLSAIRRLRIECGVQDAGRDSRGNRPRWRLAASRRNMPRAATRARHCVCSKGAALSRAVGINGFGLRTHGNATLDPYRATLGFARAGAARAREDFRAFAGDARQAAPPHRGNQDPGRHRSPRPRS